MIDVYCDAGSRYSLCPPQRVTLAAFCSPEGSSGAGSSGATGGTTNGATNVTRDSLRLATHRRWRDWSA
jgi:hypothetical protein